MKYLPLLWAGLWRKPVRTALTMLSIVTAFFLFGVLQGVNAGVQSVFEAMSVARLRVMSRANFQEPLPIAHVERIKHLDGVTDVSPLTVLVGNYQQTSNVVVALGVDTDALFRMFPEMKLPAAQAAALARTRTGVVVGAALAERRGWKIGDRIPIVAFNAVKKDGSRDWYFDIVGIYDMEQHNFASEIWAHYEYIDEGRAMDRGTAMQIVLRVADPERAPRIAQQIDELFMSSAGQTITQSEKDALQGMLAQVGDIGFLVDTIVGAVLFTLLFLTSNTMVQSIRERTPELAILRTIGFSESRVLWLVATEALVMGVSAALIGLAAASPVIPRMLERVSPDFSAIRMPAAVFAWGCVIAALLALVSGLPPALRARRLQLVDALAGR
jgi:putative ABC transport system permease protein